jgi:hypothetical protein
MQLLEFEDACPEPGLALPEEDLGLVVAAQVLPQYGCVFVPSKYLGFAWQLFRRH